MKHLAAIGLFGLACAAIRAEPVPATGGNMRFAISLPGSIPSDSITGRVLLLVAKHGPTEPRLQLGGVNMYGADVRGAKAGAVTTIDSDTLGFPERRLGDLAPGDYYVQAVLNVYTEFRRADGHVIWAHMDQWEGQNFRLAPGNLVSRPRKIHLDPHASGEIRISLDQVIPPIEVPPDTEWVKHVKIESKLLSRFWGRPIYIGATILLPKGYAANPSLQYPVIYLQGHFSLGAPFGFDTAPDRPGTKSWARQREEWTAHHLNMPEPPPQEFSRWNGLEFLLRYGPPLPVESSHEFYQAWNSEGFPRMIVVTFEHPTPYYDDSYWVNSANCGPYDDALMQEMIPYLQGHFRAIPQPYARILTGISTGGWVAFALQLYHPDFFGGAWSFAPDPVDLRRYYGGLDLYHDENAYVEKPGRYFAGGARLRVERTREMRVLGMKCWDWECQNTPTGPDGYPMPVWNYSTGKIDRTVVQYMKEHDDLHEYLARNWSRIGAKLVGKLHFVCGDDDDYYLELPLYLLENFLENTKDPYYGGSFTYGRPMKGHGWQPTTHAELVRTMARFVADHAPPGSPPARWLQ